MMEEFKIEATPDLLLEECRPLAGDEFKKIREIREDNVDVQARLVINFVAGGKETTFPPLDAGTLKSSGNQRKTTQEILV